MRYVLKRRKGHEGLWIRDTLKKSWRLSFGDREYAEHMLKEWNAKHIRNQIKLIHQNDWVLPNPDKSPELTLIVGGAA